MSALRYGSTTSGDDPEQTYAPDGTQASEKLKHPLLSGGILWVRQTYRMSCVGGVALTRRAHDALELVLVTPVDHGRAA